MIEVNVELYNTDILNNEIFIKSDPEYIGSDYGFDTYSLKVKSIEDLLEIISYFVADEFELRENYDKSRSVIYKDDEVYYDCGVTITKNNSLNEITL